MSDDRYSTITREVPVERERNTVFVPGDDHAGRDVLLEVFGGREVNSQHRVTLHPAGFRVRERGALEGTVVHAYRCPVHGLVDVRVPRSDVPDEVPCPEWVTIREPDHEEPMPDGRRWITPGRVLDDGACSRPAAWAGSRCGQGWAAGECKS